MAKPFNEELQSYYKERQDYVRKMDEIERQNGFASPLQLSYVEQLRTALFALEAGLMLRQRTGDDQDCCGDALVMLHELLEQMLQTTTDEQLRRVRPRPRGF
jgi:hypothetical protein